MTYVYDNRCRKCGGVLAMTGPGPHDVTWCSCAALPSGAAEPREPSKAAIDAARVCHRHECGVGECDTVYAMLTAAYAVDFPAVAPAPSDKVDTAVRIAGVLMEFGVEPIRAGEMAALAADVLAAVAPAGEPTREQELEKVLRDALDYIAGRENISPPFDRARALLARRREGGTE